MKKAGPAFLALFPLILLSLSLAYAAQDPSPGKLHGKALKEKEASIEVFQGIPKRSFEKVTPLWASKGNMEKTMQEIRKQAAKAGADAVIDLRVKTQKLERTYADPGFWDGPGYWGGWGPWGGPWGGVGYWGSYVQSHTYTQPVVSGWAVKWTGPGTALTPVATPTPSLQQAVEDAPSE